MNHKVHYLSLYFSSKCIYLEEENKMKVWYSPKASIEKMAADVAVSSCDVTQYYKFKCDAYGGSLYYYPQSDGKIDGIYNGTGSSQRLGSYHPCGQEHTTKKVDEYYDGYVESYLPHKKTNVIVWVERDRWGNINNGHATTKLDMSKWEKAMS